MATEEMNKELQYVAPLERKLIEKVRRGECVAKNVNLLHQDTLSSGDKAADVLARVAGSWRFISAFALVLIVWIAINSALVLFGQFDPYPFILLNLVLSCLAAIQAPVIMMSQNRQAAKDRLQADHDYEVNLKAEAEIENLHEKLDLLREKQWAELVEMQRQQIEMLQGLAKAMSAGQR